MGKWQALFSTGKTEWGTPASLFRPLNEIFHFDLDVCAARWNAQCQHYITKERDGLAQSWHDYFGPRSHIMIWMNPPYGHRVIDPWIAKIHDEWKQGAQGVAILPARTDTQWFQDYVFKAPLLLFLKGRVPFELPCCIHEQYRTSKDGCTKMTPYLYGRRPAQKPYPVCDNHAERLGIVDHPDYYRRRSVAPFPSVLAFYIHTQYWLDGKLQQVLDLPLEGIIINTNPRLGMG